MHPAISRFEISIGVTFWGTIAAQMYAEYTHTLRSNYRGNK